VERTRRILAQPMAQLVRHGPGRLMCHAQLALQKLGRDAALLILAAEIQIWKSASRQAVLRDYRPRSGISSDLLDRGIEDFSG
jgi:hypothetical protein